MSGVDDGHMALFIHGVGCGGGEKRTGPCGIDGVDGEPSAAAARPGGFRLSRTGLDHCPHRHPHQHPLLEWKTNISMVRLPFRRGNSLNGPGRYNKGKEEKKMEIS